MSDSLRDLHHELQTCQRRLGTPAETPEDWERVLALAHQINNQIAAKYLTTTMESESPPQRTLASLVREWLRL